jgi:hypothetical protein
MNGSKLSRIFTPTVMIVSLAAWADDSSLVRFEKNSEHPYRVTGKPVADTTVYDYDATADISGVAAGARHRSVSHRPEGC